MRSTLALLAATATLLISGQARADHTYVGLGVGAKAPLSGNFGGEFSTSGSKHGRLMLGHSFGLPVGAVAVEGVLFGTELVRGGDDSYHTLSVGADLKYRLNFVAGLGGYGKVGLHRTWLQADNDLIDSYAGNGYAYGGGIDYSFSFASVWFDYTRQELRLGSSRSEMDLDGAATLLSLGLSLHF